jgi:hypothetical protein
MRTPILSTIILLLLTGTGYCQAGGGENSNTLREKTDAANARDAKEQMRLMQLDRDYQDTLRKQAAPATPADPWGNVRPENSTGKTNSASKATSKKSQ